MLKKNRKILLKTIAVALCIALLSPCTALAAEVPEVQPCASYYLSCYQTYMCAVGSGKVQVWFDVMGAGTQDELGTLSIRLYESRDNQSWTRVETYLHEENSNMLAYNTYHHGSCVTYQGVAGRYYKAYVCFWGGSDGDGDSRYVWATSERAT